MTLNDRLNELAKLAEHRIAADTLGDPTEVFDAEIKNKFVSALNHNASMFGQVLQTLRSNIQDNK